MYIQYLLENWEESIVSSLVYEDKSLHVKLDCLLIDYFTIDLSSTIIGKPLFENELNLCGPSRIF